MSVYVDRGAFPYGRMKMCHMLADTLDELHAMADRLGLQRRWFQNERTPHYDICQSKRSLAISFGAIDADRQQTVAIIRKWRATEWKRKPISCAAKAISKA